MFGLGATELLLIAVVILILLAMGKLPDAAHKAGDAYRAYRKVDHEVSKLKNPATWIDVAATEEKKPDKPPPEREP